MQSVLTTNTIIDLITLGILLVGLFIGIKRGLIASVLNLVAYGTSFLIAKFQSRAAAEWIYNIYFKERLVNNITSQINEIFSGSLDVLTNLPSKNMIETIKQMADSLPYFISSNLNITNDMAASLPLTSISEFSEAFVNVIVYPPLLIILTRLMFVVIFLLALLLFKIVIKATKILKKIPILGKADKYGGAIFGLASAALFVLLAAKLTVILINFNGTNDFFGLTPTIINSTKLFKIFVNL